MRSRSLTTQHDAVVAHRLELLNTELAAVREPGPRVPSHIRAVPDLEGAGDEPPVVPAEPAPAPSLVPLPGRHASRRSAAGWAELVPEGLRGRIQLGPSQIAAVAVLVAIGLGLTCWWLLRSGGDTQAAPLTVSTPASGLATPAGSSAAPMEVATAAGGAGSTPAKVVVDVTGKVRHPGIAVLRQGARVVDALRAAGGARPGVDLGGLNLARVLIDGEQVVVGQGAAPSAVPGTAAPPGASASPGPALVDLNSADEATLESLPEVGPVTAAAIITWRTQHGGFTAVDQLLDVDGIGDATLAKLSPLVTI